MRAGDLDQRAKIQALESGQDALGQPFNTWLDIAEVWCAFEPLTGREYLAAGAMVSAVEVRVRMRYRPGINSSMRVIHDGETYGIGAVIHVKSARQELQLMCKRVG